MTYPCCGDPYGSEGVNSCWLPSEHVVTGPYWVDHERGWGIILVTTCNLHLPLVVDYVGTGSLAEPPLISEIAALPAIEANLAGDGSVWRMVPAA